MLKVLDINCTPTKGSKYSACVDLYAREEVVISRGETKLIPLGVAVDYAWINTIHFSQREDWKSSHYLQLMLRSSLGKKGLVLPNGVGVIDLDYKDEIMMIVLNASERVNMVKMNDLHRDYIGAITFRYGRKKHDIVMISYCPICGGDLK